MHWIICSVLNVIDTKHHFNAASSFIPKTYVASILGAPVLVTMLL